MPGEQRLSSAAQRRGDRRSAAAVAASRRGDDAALTPLSAEEHAELLSACNEGRVGRFDAVRFAGKCLDGLTPDGRTLLRHAAATERHAVAAALLRAGAQPVARACACAGRCDDAARTGLKAAQPAFVAWLVAALAQAPTRAGGACACCAGASGCGCALLCRLFPCCDAAVCEPCFWAACVLWDEAADAHGAGLRCPVCPPRPPPTPAELLPAGAATAAESRARFDALPEAAPLAGDSANVAWRQQADAAAPRSRAAAAAHRLGVTRAQRTTQLVVAVKAGRLLRCAALLAAGCDVEADGEDGGCGGTALYLAAWRGRDAVAELLLAAGARADAPDAAGVTPAEAAAAAGHHALAARLAAASGTPPRAPRRMPPPLAATPPTLTLCMPACDATHPGAGAAYIDGAFDEAWLAELDALFARMPLLAPAKPGGSARANFVDAPGWVCAGLAAALAAAAPAAPPGCALRSCREALPHLRFLTYTEAECRLPPHVDLPKHRASDGALSTHTFILYLRDCAGGETRLLRSASHPWPEEEGGDAPLACVAPRRGRLLLFPHACPHDGAAVLDPPKLLLRGEMM
jgi:hypothetical protein